MSQQQISFNKHQIKNIHYTRGITPERVTSGGTHLQSLALGQHSSEKTSQRWRKVGNTASDGDKSNPRLFAPIVTSLTAAPTGRGHSSIAVKHKNYHVKEKKILKIQNTFGSRNHLLHKKFIKLPATRFKIFSPLT